jgi:hypothetical protein
MMAWMEISEQQTSETILPPEQSGLEDEIHMFWQNRTAGRIAKRSTLPILETVIETEILNSS